ncbi:MAG: PfkB family carbohydrate kinase [Chloroflexota bacterium]|nr:PfkB family carbohydrate kinase [Chloroflexota bacterium]
MATILMNLLSLVPRLAGHHITVVGDVILDEYIVGTATRMSREAPIPVLEFEQRQLIPGGAANPAANVAALGSAARLVGIVGADNDATTLRQVLQARGIATDGLVVDGGRPTTVKTRILAQMGLRFPQQVARIDRLSRADINGSCEQRIAEALSNADKTEAYLLSDYQNGLITPPVIDAVRDAAAVGTRHASSAHTAPLLAADAQGQFDKYGGFGVVKCNANEARTYLRRDLHTHDEFAAAARDLCERLRLTIGMVITRGADGATICHADGSTAHCPAPAITDVYDTVGAGDTAIAILTLAIVAGATLTEAATLANYASGVVVRRVGNYTPSAAELVDAIEQYRTN